MTVRPDLTAVACTYLANCDPSKAYEWLEINFQEPEMGAIGGGPLFYSGYDSMGRDRIEIGNTLLARHDPVVDLALAQFGPNDVLREIYSKGDIGTRCAVLANANLFESNQPAVDLSELVERDSYPELCSLASNAFLPCDLYKDIINRNDMFSELRNDSYMHMVSLLGDNKRFEFESNRPEDFYSSVYFSPVFAAAWDLSLSIPTEHPWIYWLDEFLAKMPAVEFSQDKVRLAIARWQLSPKEGSEPDDGLFMRARLATFLHEDESLLNSPDLALRCSFYQRFSPIIFGDWPNLVRRDLKDFRVYVESYLNRNHNIWSSATERRNLKTVMRTDANAMANFAQNEKQYRKLYPRWFADEELSN